jgi:hypothetical protein
VHGSLKYVPFSGLEQTNSNYLEIMSSLIKPVEDDYEEEKVSSKQQQNSTSKMIKSTEN